MSEHEQLLSFPPSSERKVFGLLRPAQVAALLIGLALGLFALTSLSLGVALLTCAVLTGLVGMLCLFKVDGEPIEAAVFGLVWLTLPKACLKLLGTVKPVVAPDYFVVTLHHPDRYLEEVDTQWQRTAAVGRALAAGAQAMKTQVQFLTLRRTLLTADVLDQLVEEPSAHPLVTLVLARATPEHELHFSAMVQALSETGMRCGPVTRLNQSIVELGTVRHVQRNRCVTRNAHLSVSALRTGPALGVSPTAFLDLLVNPPWSLFAVTICPLASQALQRRIERRQTAALANEELLERRGFRRSAAQERQTSRAADYEAAIARGERAVLLHLHVGCVERTEAELHTARKEFLSRAERCGLGFTSLSGRHHLGAALFGAPEVLA